MTSQKINKERKKEKKKKTNKQYHKAWTSISWPGFLQMHVAWWAKLILPWTLYKSHSEGCDTESILFPKTASEGANKTATLIYGLGDETLAADSYLAMNRGFVISPTMTQKDCVPLGVVGWGKMRRGRLQNCCFRFLFLSVCKMRSFSRWNGRRKVEMTSRYHFRLCDYGCRIFQHHRGYKGSKHLHPAQLLWTGDWGTLTISNNERIATEINCSQHLFGKQITFW